MINNKIKFNNHRSATRMIVKMKVMIANKIRMEKKIVKIKIARKRVAALLLSSLKIMR